jgi:hypothetical protein
MMQRFLWLLALVAISAFADDRPILTCVAITDDTDRLACYDRLGQVALQRLRSERPAEPATPVAQKQEVQVQEPDDTPREADFGKPPPKVEAPVKQVRSRIVDLAVTPRGQRVITLANGQVWIENEAGKEAIPMAEDVTISKRIWRYTMRFDSGQVIAVKRIE